MRILVDADACPVKKIIVRVAKALKIEVVMFTDMAHEIEDGYSKVVKVDIGRDAVDYALIGQAQAGDLVVTQDYGVAAVSLGKKCLVMDQNGRQIDDHNIEILLTDRHIAQKMRKATGRSGKIKKRQAADDSKFEAALRQICEKYHLAEGVRA